MWSDFCLNKLALPYWPQRARPHRETSHEMVRTFHSQRWWWWGGVLWQERCWEVIIFWIYLEDLASRIWRKSGNQVWKEESNQWWASVWLSARRKEASVSWNREDFSGKEVMARSNIDLGHAEISTRPHEEVELEAIYKILELKGESPGWRYKYEDYQHIDAI